ncbi:MAG TPA: TIGR03000 domain-containing protein [Gemmataceae bacterium]
MRTYDATTRRQWRKKVAGGALVLLGLAGIGLPNSRAQLRYSGGFVRTPRDRSDSSRPVAPQVGAPTTSPNTPPSYFPDNDFFLRQAAASPLAAGTNRTPSYSPDHDFGSPSYNPATTSATRSSYAGGESGRPASPPAGEPPSGVSAADLPWNQEGFKGYDEPPEIPRDSSLFSPRKYVLEATPLPQGPPAGRPAIAILIARLPEHALFWVEGRLTRLRGPTRYFQSPPLPAGGKYSYTVRVAWIEDGQWVSQTQKIPVQAGLIQAIYLQPR